MYSESRIVPGTTTAPIPATWSLIALSQVSPWCFWPKYFGFGAAFSVWTGTTNRRPSAEATRPPPHSRASGIWAWCSISRAFAALIVSART